MTEAIQEGPDQNSNQQAEVKRGPGRPPKVAAEKTPAAEPLLVQTGVTDEPVPSGVVNSKTKFYKGVWANKSNPTDCDAVRIAVNGETITFQRGVEVIVPYPYLEAAKHATYAKFKQEPGKGRKVAAYIDRFPFTKTGEATYEEFRKAFLEGTKATKKAIETWGLQVPVPEGIPQTM